MVSNLSKSCYYLLLASISQSWMVSVSAAHPAVHPGYAQVYLAACAGLEGGVGNIVNRSIVAAMVSQQELGAVYGLLAILDAVLPFLVCPASTALYSATQDTLPAAFCFLNVAILMVGCLLFLAMYTISLKYKLNVKVK